MISHRLTRSAKTLGTMTAVATLAAGVALGVAGPSSADSAPTPIRPATDLDMVEKNYPTDYVWVAIQDPKSKAKLLTTTLPDDSILPPLPFIGYNVTKPNGDFQNILNLGTGGPIKRGTNPVSVGNSNWNLVKTGADTWKWTVNDKGLVADIDITGSRPGATMDTVDWDGQQVFWASSIATAEANGWITYPDGERVEVKNWAAEEERMAGNFVLGPGHKGYDYAQSGNPDGSADQLFGYPQLDGSFKGLITHVTKDGKMTACHDPILENSDYVTKQIIKFPTKVRAYCSAPDPLEITYYVTDPHVLPLSATNFGFNPGGSPDGQNGAGLGDYLGLGSTSMSGGVSDVPGSVATIQHLRDHPFTGAE